MNDLADRMRAATANPPPTSIDIDRLIAAERHRSRQLGWASAAGGAATAVAAAVFAVTVLPGWGAARGGEPGGLVVPGVELCAPLTPSPTEPMPPEQSYGTVRDRPTEPVADAASRLSAVLDDALRTQLPGAQVTALGLPDCERPQFQYHPSYKNYFAGVGLSDGEGAGRLSLELRPTGAEEPPACAAIMLDGYRCERRTLPGGAVATVETFPKGPGKQYQVIVDRPDGTSVFMVANNVDYGGNPNATPKVTRPAPVVTVDQMIALGTTPGLTLYP